VKILGLGLARTVTGGDGEPSSIQLIAEKAVTAREGLRERSNLIREVEGLLIDDQFLKGEGPVVPPDQEVASGEKTAGEPRSRQTPRGD
jgi:hypothetical protein